MTALGNWRMASAPDTGIVAVSSLAMVIGLVVMIAGRPVGTVAAQGAAGDLKGTIAMEVSRAEPQLVARDGRTDRVEALNPLTERKSDRRLERTAIVQELMPRATEALLTLGPIPPDEMLLGALPLPLLAPWLGE